MFFLVPVLCLSSLLRGFNAVNREAPRGRGLIKRDSQVPVGLDRVDPLNAVEPGVKNHTKMDDSVNSRAAKKYEGWAAAAALMLEAGYDPHSTPPDPAEGMQANLKEEDAEVRMSVPTSRTRFSDSLAQDPASVSIDASGRMVEMSPHVVVYDETVPEDETYGGRRRVRSQYRIKAARKRIQQEVEEYGDPDECYNEWTAWDIWKCVHRECGGLANFKKKRSRRLKSTMLLRQESIQDCHTRPEKNVHVAYCTTSDTMTPDGLVHGSPEHCDDKISHGSQKGAEKGQQPTQVQLDHPGNEEVDYGTLAL